MAFQIDDLSGLTSAEVSIYRYVLQNMEKVQFMRVRDLAEATHVSSASITRFIRKIGFESFAEFRLKMKEETKQSGKKELSNANNAIYEFLDNVDNHAFEKNIDYIVETILEGHTLVFLGTGSSGSIAEYGARMLSNIGVPAFSIKDPYYPFDSLMEMSANLMFIVLSVSGEMPVVNELVTNLRKNEKNFVLSITSTPNNNLAKLSNMNLPYHFEKEVVGKNYIMTSSVPVIYLLEFIARQTYRAINNVEK